MLISKSMMYNSTDSGSNSAAWILCWVMLGFMKNIETSCWRKHLTVFALTESADFGHQNVTQKSQESKKWLCQELKFFDFLERLDVPVPEKPINWWLFLSMGIPGFHDKAGSAYYLKVKQAWILVLSCFPRFSGLSGVKKSMRNPAKKASFSMLFALLRAFLYDCLGYFIWWVTTHTCIRN